MPFGDTLEQLFELMGKTPYREGEPTIPQFRQGYPEYRSPLSGYTYNKTYVPEPRGVHPLDEQVLALLKSLFMPPTQPCVRALDRAVPGRADPNATYQEPWGPDPFRPSR